MDLISIEPMLCVRCGWHHNVAAFPPRPGQIMVCYNCGYLSVKLEEGAREMTEEDARVMPADQREELANMLRAWVVRRQLENWRNYANEEGGHA